MSKSELVIEHNGRLVAVIRREGGGRSGKPALWLAYWGLAYQQLPHRRFAHRIEAQEWVLQMLLQLGAERQAADSAVAL